MQHAATKGRKRPFDNREMSETGQGDGCIRAGGDAARVRVESDDASSPMDASSSPPAPTQPSCFVVPLSDSDHTPPLSRISGLRRLTAAPAAALSRPRGPQHGCTASAACAAVQGRTRLRGLCTASVYGVQKRTERRAVQKRRRLLCAPWATFEVCIRRPGPAQAARPKLCRGRARRHLRPAHERGPALHSAARERTRGYGTRESRH